jgi:shikimate kinase
MNIVLIGMRSCGKSNVARRLSVFMKRFVLSTDVLISYENQGEDISTIITKNSGDWQVFRELEYLVIKKIITQDDLIIDTGGGSVVDLDPDGNEILSKRKVDLLKKNGLLIWLRGSIFSLVDKTKNDSNRPTLNKKLSYSDLMQLRLPFYHESSDIIIDVDGKKRKEIALEIMDNLKKYPEFAHMDFYKS